MELLYVYASSIGDQRYCRKGSTESQRGELPFCSPHSLSSVGRFYGILLLFTQCSRPFIRRKKTLRTAIWITFHRTNYTCRIENLISSDICTTSSETPRVRPERPLRHPFWAMPYMWGECGKETHPLQTLSIKRRNIRIFVRRWFGEVGRRRTCSPNIRPISARSRRWRRTPQCTSRKNGRSLPFTTTARTR